MKVSEYIKELQRLQEEVGDVTIGKIFKDKTIELYAPYPVIINIGSNLLGEDNEEGYAKYIII